jgi:hypothetical protein
VQGWEKEEWRERKEADGGLHIDKISLSLERYLGRGSAVYMEMWRIL